MKLHNPNRKLYSCEQCNKKFTQKANLKAHMRAHSNERPFECKTCKKRFKSKGCLNKHVRFFHNKKSYECALCGKAFRYECELNKHTTRHSFILREEGVRKKEDKEQEIEDYLYKPLELNFSSELEEALIEQEAEQWFQI